MLIFICTSLFKRKLLILIFLSIFANKIQNKRAPQDLKMTLIRFEM